MPELLGVGNEISNNRRSATGGLSVNQKEYGMQSRHFTKWIWLVTAGLAIVPPAIAVQHSARAQSGTPSAAATSKAAASVQASNGSQPGQPTAPTPATAQKIAALPEPFP